MNNNIGIVFKNLLILTFTVLVTPIQAMGEDVGQRLLASYQEEEAFLAKELASVSDKKKTICPETLLYLDCFRMVLKRNTISTPTGGAIVFEGVLTFAKKDRAENSITPEKLIYKMNQVMIALLESINISKSVLANESSVKGMREEQLEKIKTEFLSTMNALREKIINAVTKNIAEEIVHLESTKEDAVLIRDYKIQSKEIEIYKYKTYRFAR